MGVTRHKLAGMQENEEGHWVRIEDMRSALSSPEAAGGLRKRLPGGRNFSTVDLIAGLREAFDASVGGKPNYLESDYEVVRDAVMCAFNPPDEDCAEPGICSEAICRASRFIAAQPCQCTNEMIEDHDPCKRCEVLGRLGDKPMIR